MTDHAKKCMSLKTMAKKDCDCDGYHTFGELYEHRIALFIALCEQRCGVVDGNGDQYFEDVWRSKTHSDGTVMEGWFILGIGENPGEQITYHLPLKDWEKCDFAETLDKAPKWDGHTSDDVLERVRTLDY